MNDTPPLPTERLGNKLEELRAVIAAEAPRTGLEGTLQRAFLRLFEVLLSLLAALKDGRFAGGALAAGGLAGAAPGAAFAAGTAGAPCAANADTQEGSANGELRLPHARCGVAHEAGAALAASPAYRCEDEGADRGSSAAAQCAAAGANRPATSAPPAQAEVRPRSSPGASLPAAGAWAAIGRSPFFYHRSVPVHVARGFSFFALDSKNGRIGSRLSHEYFVAI